MSDDCLQNRKQIPFGQPSDFSPLEFIHFYSLGTGWAMEGNQTKQAES